MNDRGETNGERREGQNGREKRQSGEEEVIQGDSDIEQRAMVRMVGFKKKIKTIKKGMTNPNRYNIIMIQTKMTSSVMITKQTHSNKGIKNVD